MARPSGFRRVKAATQEPRHRKAFSLLKTLVFLVSALPVFLLVKSLLFKRNAGPKAAVSNFSKQVGYLATGIGTVLVIATLYQLVNAWLR